MARALAAGGAVVEILAPMPPRPAYSGSHYRRPSGSRAGSPHHQCDFTDAGPLNLGPGHLATANGKAWGPMAPQGATGEAGIPVHAVRYARRPALFYGAGAPDNLARSWRARAQVPSFMLGMAAHCWRRSAVCTHLISHWLLPCGVVAASAAGRGLPHLAVAHSSDVHLLARLPGAGALLHALARPRTRLLCTCAAIRDKLLPLCPTARARAMVEDALIMRMGLDRGPVAILDTPRRRAVLFLGRLVPVKGVDLLLEAMEGLPGAELWVAGDGPARADLERAARERGIRHRFFGLVAGQEKADLLARAGVLALPSRVLPDGRTDAAPVVLLEAMAAGLPVVATRVGGNAELIEDGVNGLLIPEGDHRALALALALALDDDGGLAKAGRRTARAHSWDVLGPRVLEVMAGL